MHVVELLNEELRGEATIRLFGFKKKKPEIPIVPKGPGRPRWPEIYYRENGDTIEYVEGGVYTKGSGYSDDRYILTFPTGEKKTLILNYADHEYNRKLISALTKLYGSSTSNRKTLIKKTKLRWPLPKNNKPFQQD